MKYSTAFLTLAGWAIATPVPAVHKRQFSNTTSTTSSSLDYVQNYNGNLANFQYDQGAGTYSASWSNPGDFVVGLGWGTGSAE